MIGLIAIQIYWINNSIKLRDAQFRYNVKAALAAVSQDLEHRETQRRMKGHLTPKMISTLDSLNKARKSARASIRQAHGDTTVFFHNHGETMGLTLRKSRNEVVQLKDMPGGIKHIRKDEPDMSSLFPDDSVEVSGKVKSAEDSISYSNSVKMLLELYAPYIAQEFDENFKTLYPVSLIDSLIKTKLLEVGGIDASYKFAVLNGNGDPEEVLESNQTFLPQIEKSDYRIRLFPSDYASRQRFLKIYFPDQRIYLVRTLGPLLFSSAILLLLIIGAFAYTIYTIYKQKKISDIKNDFINNMTHELKTPISTISLACQVLTDPQMKVSDAQTSSYIAMIRDENRRLGVLVENVLRSAVIDRGEMVLKFAEVNLHHVIRNAIRNIAIQAERKGGKITTSLKANEPIIEGDSIHLANMVYNLLDNAIKYTKTQPEIEVSSWNEGNSLFLRFSDNGIGISKEEQERIFEKLYRVPTGNVHDIKGFGLGLSYVKLVVEKHGGSVSVTSELSKGSKFTVQLPLKHDS